MYKINAPGGDGNPDKSVCVRDPFIKMATGIVVGNEVGHTPESAEINGVGDLLFYTPLLGKMTYLRYRQQFWRKIPHSQTSTQNIAVDKNSSADNQRIKRPQLICKFCLTVEYNAYEYLLQLEDLFANIEHYHYCGSIKYS